MAHKETAFSCQEQKPPLPLFENKSTWIQEGGLEMKGKEEKIRMRTKIRGERRDCWRYDTAVNIQRLLTVLSIVTVIMVAVGAI